MTTVTHKDLLISNPGQGKQVSFAPSLKEQAFILQSAKKNGFYYPVMAMKHLEALSTGLSGKHNVFIPNTKDFMANSFQKVVVFVPGIRATVERRSNDTLVVTELWLDPNESYKDIERGSTQKPGVYEVSRLNNKLDVKYKKNGRISAKDERKVVIADTKHETPEEAARESLKGLEYMFGANAALKCDFDLFYSPVGSRLGGMRNYNPHILSQGYLFAGLLADAMEKSINHKGVEWTSELGGSVVLTQALQTLAYKNLSFAHQKHVVKMHLPSTDPGPTLVAATHLGMLVDKNMAKGNGNIRATVSSLMTNAGRARDKNDLYTWKDYAKHLSEGSASTMGAVGLLSFGATLMISSPVLTTVGTVASSVGALQFAYNTFKKRLKKGF